MRVTCAVGAPKAHRVQTPVHTRRRAWICLGRSRWWSARP